MDTKKLLEDIGKLIDEKLEQKLEQKLEEKLNQKLEPIKKVMATKTDLQELKEELHAKIDNAKAELQAEIISSQEDTIEVLSGLIETGYMMHDKRIGKIEDILDIEGHHKN